MLALQCPELLLDKILVEALHNSAKHGVLLHVLEAVGDITRNEHEHGESALASAVRRLLEQRSNSVFLELLANRKNFVSFVNKLVDASSILSSTSSSSTQTATSNSSKKSCCFFSFNIICNIVLYCFVAKK